MTALPSTPKLGKLVALLSSDKDGERLGAIAAIERTLQSAGLTFHDLARAINGIEIRADGINIRARAPAASPLAPSLWEVLPRSSKVAWLQALLRTDWLTPDERDCLTDLDLAVRCWHQELWGYQVKTMNRLIAIATDKGVRP